MGGINPQFTSGQFDEKLVHVTQTKSDQRGNLHCSGITQIVNKATIYPCYLLLCLVVNPKLNAASIW